MGHSTQTSALQRFLQAQTNGTYETALQELQQGQKRSHWMWFIFPQINGIGYSATSRRYAISDLTEAKQYLQHSILGPRLIECMTAVNSLEGLTAHQIFGSPDDMKLHACATLFSLTSDDTETFNNVLKKYFQCMLHQQTMQILRSDSESSTFS